MKNKESNYKLWIKELRRRKLRKTLRSYLWLVLGVLIIMVSFIVFLTLNAKISAYRGYNAIGGEMFIPFIPILIIIVRDFFHDLVDVFNRHK